MKSTKKIALALTGASGAPYFLRLLERLRARADVEGHLLASEGGKRVLWEESGVKWADIETGGFTIHANRDIGANLASGSYRLDALAVVPCSMNTISAAACGLAGNLILRTAAVQLKEGRKLIVVPREAPLSLINLKAMTTLCEAGAVLLPAMPGFYHHPATIGDLVDSVVDRILDHLGLEDEAIRRWNP